MQRTSHTTYLSKFLLPIAGVIIAVFTGCDFFEVPDAFPTGATSAPQTGTAEVRFSYRLPADGGRASLRLNSLRPSVVNATGTASVKFRIVIPTPGRRGGQSLVQEKVVTLSANQSSAQVSFSGLPERTTVGQVQLDNCHIAGVTDFHAACDLTAGTNELEVVPVGSMDRADVVAHVIESSLHSQEIMANAPANMAQSIEAIVPPTITSTTASASIFNDTFSTFTRQYAPGTSVFLGADDAKPEQISAFDTMGKRLWYRKNTAVWQPIELWGTKIDDMHVDTVLRQPFDGYGYVGWKHRLLSPYGVAKIDSEGNRLAWVRNSGRCDVAVLMADESLIVGGTNDDMRCPVLFRWKGNVDASTYSNAGGPDENLIWAHYFEELYANQANQHPKVLTIQYDGYETLVVTIENPNSADTGFPTVKYRVHASTGQTTRIRDAIDEVVNQLPRVRITNPESGTQFVGGVPVPIAVDASDNDGTIARVVFSVDGRIISEITSPPYNYTWLNPVEGDRAIGVIAYDNLGSSREDKISIRIGRPPQLAGLSITSPASGTTLWAGDTVTVTVSSPNAGNIKIYNYDQIIGTVSPSQGIARYAWTAPPPGQAFLTAWATDNDGNIAVSQAVPVFFTPRNTPPDAPFLFSPTPGGTADDDPPILMTYSMSDADFDRHQCSDWEVSTDADMQDIVWASRNDTSNLTVITCDTLSGQFSGSLEATGKLHPSTWYYVRTRHCDAKDNWGDWCEPMPFRTRQSSSEHGTLAGYVFDGTTGDPVIDAEFVLSVGSSNLTARTNFLGQYEIRSIDQYYTTFSGEVTAGGYTSVRIGEIRVEQRENVALEPIYLTPAGTGNATGRIVSAMTGEAVGGVNVSIRRGMNTLTGSIAATAVTDAGGNFQFPGRPAGCYTAEVTATNYITTNFNLWVLPDTTTTAPRFAVSPADLGENDWRVVLSWHTDHLDLDTHVTAPNPAGGRYHAYFARKSPGNLVVNRIENIGFGPETITVLNPQTGVIRVMVHDYTHRETVYSSAMEEANAILRIYKGSALHKTIVAPVGDGTFWNAFAITGGNVVPVGRMSYLDDETNVP